MVQAKLISKNGSISTNKKKEIIYEIMHMEKVVAKVTSNGKAKILEEDFMPYDLYLDEDDDDIDVRINNINVFNHWCASRVLS